MILNIKYTQSTLIEGQQVQTKLHAIECSDTETFSNGKPKPIGDDLKWSSIIESMNEFGVFITSLQAKYEIF